MDRVGVLVHPTRHVLAGLEVLQAWTAARGVELVQIPTAEQPQVAPPGTVTSDDLIVALGGDGTILKALHTSAPTRTPVLGVAYGSLGALTTVPTDHLRGALDRFAEGEWHARELPALRLRADDIEVASAINDVVVSRKGGGQLLLDVWLDGELYVRVAGDGAVVSTPLGSGAYSMAAGGPLIAEGTDAMVCTPVAMHGGCAPPLLVSGGREIGLQIHPGHSGRSVEVDGFALDVEAEHIRVTRQRAYATLVALDDAQTGISRLRARGLISDSPRLAGAKQLLAEIQS